MFCVIFEVLPAEGKRDEYLGLVQQLRSNLEAIDGYVDSERFESRLKPGWILTLQTWRDEKSVVRWRTEREHHAIQVKGRFHTFADYHVRGGDVTSDTDPPKEAPVHERRFDETEVGKAKLATFTEIVPVEGAAFATQVDALPAHLGLDTRDGAVVEHDVLASIYNPGKVALLVGWRDAKAAECWMPTKIDGVATLRHRKVRVVRDYGRFDRREAPQYYEDAKGRDTLHAQPARAG